MGIIIAIAAVLIAFILIAIAAKKNPQDDSSQPPRENYVDAQNLPPYFSREQCEEIEKIANFYGVRYVTGTETRNWILHNLKELFSSMPGWDIWDSSIHEADGQFERAERGGVNKGIYILCYDSKYKLAKIQGKTGIYLTSCNRCSCPDFRKRRLPCKHMYMLAYELGGNIEKTSSMTTMHHYMDCSWHLPDTFRKVLKELVGFEPIFLTGVERGQMILMNLKVPLSLLAPIRLFAGWKGSNRLILRFYPQNPLETFLLRTLFHHKLI